MGRTYSSVIENTDYALYFSFEIGERESKFKQKGIKYMHISAFITTKTKSYIVKKIQ